MDLNPIEGSSNIDGEVYHDGTLYVRFKSGKTYRYSNVTPETYEKFKAAESKGKYFISNIKPHHDCEKCDE